MYRHNSPLVYRSGNPLLLRVTAQISRFQELDCKVVTTFTQSLYREAQERTKYYCDFCYDSSDKYMNQAWCFHEYRGLMKRKRNFKRS